MQHCYRSPVVLLGFILSEERDLSAPFGITGYNVSPPCTP